MDVSVKHTMVYFYSGVLVEQKNKCQGTRSQATIFVKIEATIFWEDGEQPFVCITQSRTEVANVVKPLQPNAHDKNAGGPLLPQILPFYCRSLQGALTTRCDTLHTRVECNEKTDQLNLDLWRIDHSQPRLRIQNTCTWDLGAWDRQSMRYCAVQTFPLKSPQ